MKKLKLTTILFNFGYFGTNHANDFNESEDWEIFEDLYNRWMEVTVEDSLPFIPEENVDLSMEILTVILDNFSKLFVLFDYTEDEINQLVDITGIKNYDIIRNYLIDFYNLNNEGDLSMEDANTQELQFVSDDVFGNEFGMNENKFDFVSYFEDDSLCVGIKSDIQFDDNFENVEDGTFVYYMYINPGESVSLPEYNSLNVEWNVLGRNWTVTTNSGDFFIIDDETPLDVFGANKILDEKFKRQKLGADWGVNTWLVKSIGDLDSGFFICDNENGDGYTFLYKKSHEEDEAEYNEISSYDYENVKDLVTFIDNYDTSIIPTNDEEIDNSELISDIQIFIKGNTYFDDETEDDVIDTLCFTTRDNGDTNQEVAGSEDLNEAQRIRILLMKKFDNIKVTIEEVDEFVYIWVTILKK